MMPIPKPGTEVRFDRAVHAFIKASGGEFATDSVDSLPYYGLSQNQCGLLCAWLELATACFNRGNDDRFELEKLQLASNPPVLLLETVGLIAADSGLHILTGSFDDDPTVGIRFDEYFLRVLNGFRMRAAEAVKAMVLGVASNTIPTISPTDLVELRCEDPEKDDCACQYCVVSNALLMGTEKSVDSIDFDAIFDPYRVKSSSQGGNDVAHS